MLYFPKAVIKYFKITFIFSKIVKYVYIFICFVVISSGVFTVGGFKGSRPPKPLGSMVLEVMPKGDSRVSSDTVKKKKKDPPWRYATP